MAVASDIVAQLLMKMPHFDGCGQSFVSSPCSIDFNAWSHAN